MSIPHFKALISETMQYYPGLNANNHAVAYWNFERIHSDSIKQWISRGRDSLDYSYFPSKEV